MSYDENESLKWRKEVIKRRRRVGSILDDEI